MADVFISYRHVSPDQDLAAELARYLGDRRVSFFIDTEIRIAEEWVKVIDSELRASKALVVLLSADSIRSDAVRYEVKLAHEAKKRIFPVRVGYDGALPLDLGYYLDRIQYKLWRQGESFAPICGAILDGLRGNRAQGGAQPPRHAPRLEPVQSPDRPFHRAGAFHPGPEPIALQHRHAIPSGRFRARRNPLA